MCIRDSNRELDRSPQWLGSHGGAAPFWRTPHTVHGPMGSSTERGATTRHSQLHMAGSFAGREGGLAHSRPSASTPAVPVK
eukprot:6532131-Pyramimonas_sp.AAC.1